MRHRSVNASPFSRVNTCLRAAGELGPSTIVGSAAFNLLVISAVCVTAIPKGEGRLIKDRSVFAITATFSVLA